MLVDNGTRCSYKKYTDTITGYIHLHLDGAEDVPVVTRVNEQTLSKMGYILKLEVFDAFPRGRSTYMDRTEICDVARRLIDNVLGKRLLYEHF